MNNKDAELIQQTLDGDQSAFSTLVEKYQKGVHALVWQKIGDFHIAQEITQDAFLRAYQKLSTLKNHKLFSGWLYVIATRLCYEWLRKKRLPILSLESIDNSEVDQMAYKQYLEKEREDDAKDKQRELVRDLLKKLPESERTVITLHYLGEMKCETISEFLGVSPNTVRSRLSRARNRLKKEEYMIHENLNSFQLPINMTENIMKNIAQLKPTTPPITKPLFPWAVSATSAILAIMLMGIGVENHLRFQQPYSLDATSESMIEIVDAQLVLDVPTKLITWKQVGGTNVSGINSGTDHEQNTTLTAADEKIVTVSIESKREWRQTNGPSGGNVNTLFATSEGILLAGTGIHGIFRSTDLGASWSAANSGLSPTNKSQSLHVKTFAQKGDTIYASVHPSLYASIDSGKTWSLVPTPPQIDTISGIVFVGNRIYISVHPEGRGIGGIWYSDDEKSWMQLNEGLKDLRIRKFAKIGTTLVVGTENGAYRKKATDNSWHPIMQPSSTGIRVDSIAVMDNLLYIGLYNEKDNNSGEIFRSDDEGDSWTLISPKDTGSTIKGLAVSESTLYASSGGSVFRSDDRGDSWIPVNKGIIDKAGSGLVAISPDTVFVNTNHQIPWLHITNSDLSAMTIFDQTGEGSIFRTTNGGNSWTEANTGIMTTSIVDLEVLGDRIYAFTGNRLFYRANGWGNLETN